MRPYFCRRKSGVAVPIDILICSVRIDMLAVFNVKSAVIMLGIVSAIFPSSAVMPCQFHSIVFSPFVQFSIRRKLPVPCTQGTGQFRSFSPKAELGRRAALLPVLPISASGNTQYGATHASLLLGNGCRPWPAKAFHPWPDKGLPPLTRTGMLHSLYPCTKGIRPLYSRHRIISFTIPKNSLVKIPAVLQIPCQKFLQKKSQFTIHFHWKFFDNWLFRLSCIIFSFTMKKQRCFYAATAQNICVKCFMPSR